MCGCRKMGGGPAAKKKRESFCKLQIFIGSARSFAGLPRTLAGRAMRCVDVIASYAVREKRRNKGTQNIAAKGYTDK